ncbi:hypothetical protein SCLCIDRAFT_764590 [Scleroderma citrinum Foug A]|uniref:Uncharacterized protein n=1 Tax=Scleroderma citrinum Foug A TaxID=1036808 RepID=A0A0C3E4B7_9AGAM|nr:hypothetical protein SCLCIDRAFT_764590 [Scleroderma citrinum Foug A]
MERENMSTLEFPVSCGSGRSTRPANAPRCHNELAFDKANTFARRGRLNAQRSWFGSVAEVRVRSRCNVSKRMKAFILRRASVGGAKFHSRLR